MTTQTSFQLFFTFVSLRVISGIYLKDMVDLVTVDHRDTFTPAFVFHHVSLRESHYITPSILFTFIVRCYYDTG